MHKATVVFDGSTAEQGYLLLHPQVNISTGSQYFESAFGQLTSLEHDLLTVASAIYACDLAFKRGERELFPRKIELKIPVVNFSTFRNIADDLQYALLILSNDAWCITFVQRNGTPEPTQIWQQTEYGKVLLFSGGLDSLAASVLFGQHGDRVQLVSHITANRIVSGSQVTLFNYLKVFYPDQFQHDPIRVGARNNVRRGFLFPSDQNREETQRTRSFLFLVLAALIARRRGFIDVVYIAENGQMAIHLPLTTARIGAFSTHTAHPEFVHVMSQLLQTILNYPLQIVNPFLYLTKAQVVANVVQTVPQILKGSVSCWKASRVTGAFNHCGFCIPCLIRRIAVETHNISISEYARDIFNENVSKLPSHDDGKRNLMELGEFVHFFEGPHAQAKIEEEYPELINSWIDSQQAIQMYRRFASEARTVFNRYPQLREVMT